jgi:hypothetical protein
MGITRKTLYRIERGVTAVALGTYARVLQTLGLDRDVVGRKLQDAGLEPICNDGPPPLRHQESPAFQVLRNPIGVRESATGKRLDLPVDVILHAPDFWLGVIEY